MQQRRGSIDDAAMSDVSVTHSSGSFFYSQPEVITDLQKLCSANDSYRLFMESINMALKMVVDGDSKEAVSGMIRVIGRSYRKMLEEKTAGIPTDKRMRAMICETYESAIAVNETNELAKEELAHFRATFMKCEIKAGFDAFRTPIYEYKKGKISCNKTFLYEFIRDHFDQLDTLFPSSKTIIPELLYRIGKEYEAGSAICLHKDQAKEPYGALARIFIVDAAKLGHQGAIADVSRRRGPSRSCLYTG